MADTFENYRLSGKGAFYTKTALPIQGKAGFR